MVSPQRLRRSVRHLAASGRSQRRGTGNAAPCAGPGLPGRQRMNAMFLASYFDFGTGGYPPKVARRLRATNITAARGHRRHDRLPAERRAAGQAHAGGDGGQRLRPALAPLRFCRRTPGPGGAHLVSRHPRQSRDGYRQRHLPCVSQRRAAEHPSLRARPSMARRRHVGRFDRARSESCICSFRRRQEWFRTRRCSSISFSIFP